MRKISSTNYSNEMAMTAKCPITFTMITIGGRWKVIILWNLRNKPLRYSELKKAIPNISEKMLIQQLKELEKDEWVIKRNYNEIPPKTDYSLSKLAKSFTPILESIYKWGVKNKITEK